MTLIRIIRIVFSQIVKENGQQYLIIQEYEILNWVTLGLQTLIVLSLRFHPQLLISICIPFWMLLTTISVNPRMEEYNFYTFLFNNVFHMTFWYLHLMMSNINWIATSVTYLVCAVFHFIVYVIKIPPNEQISEQLSFLFIILLSHVIYVLLSFFSDKQQKVNFHHNLMLEQENQNLIEILKLFPDPLLILAREDEEESDSNSILKFFSNNNFQHKNEEGHVAVPPQIMHKNDLMEEFEQISMNYEKTDKHLVFQKFQGEDILDSSNPDLEQVSFSIANNVNQSQIQLSSYSNQPINQENNNNENRNQIHHKETLWDIIHTLQNDEKITLVSKSKRNRQDGSQEGDMFLEIKLKNVIFKQTKARLIVLRDNTDIIRSQYDRSMAKLSEIMIASTSHDMRTPLLSIIMMHEMIQSKLQKLPANEGWLIKDKDADTWLRVSKNSSQLLRYLVNDTLDYFQIKSGKFTQKPIKFKAIEIVEFSFDLISIQMSRKNLEKIVEIDDEIQNEEFTFDKERIRIHETYLQKKFSAHSLANNMQASEYERFINVRFSVIDSGIGIKNSDQKKLFKFFGKLNQNDEINPTGIGLGLTICDNILMQMNSKLKVQSTYGQGTTFYFELLMPAQDISLAMMIRARQQTEIQVQLQSNYSSIQRGIPRIPTLETMSRFNKINPAVEYSQRQAQQTSDELLPNEDQETNRDLIKRMIVNENSFNTGHSNDDQKQYSSLVFKDTTKKSKNHSRQPSATFQKIQQENVNLMLPLTIRHETLEVIQNQQMMASHNQTEEMKLQYTDRQYNELDNFIRIESLMGQIEPASYENSNNRNCDCIRILIGYNGVEAVNIVTTKLQQKACSDCYQKNYDLIFMDISMPIMDGYEASDKIRQLEKEINISTKSRAYIVGLTAHSTETYQNQCYKSGMSQFMVKPVENELMDKLLQQLGLKQDYMPDLNI
ncbi:multi-sensor hybrid histidine kinase [Stylonychia lemnae]|uniref:Multi-sensor hybrid histidine kinase n=1 Tax=Stylonychia lemnae TaxID=5949 RepID=A0A078B6K5_STYLE|nr:multi-sensor hybrid histidine kinase [Stylonychia lemnae]|eukprot:CDW89193.1 multi-sensor hybrid histidine kinase [Stylonychia lemnae]